jgi:phosphopantothenoylcysteine decarboxylase / phosphopantothenate---cysteine ligase
MTGTAYNDCIAIIVGAAMASLTVRNIGEDVKKRLRIRAARHGRSMEEEIRHILASTDSAGPAAHGRAEQEDDSRQGQRSAPITGKHKIDDHAPNAANAVSRAVGQGTSLAVCHILLVIGGGIAAYKSLDLIRRLKERGAALRVVLSKAAQEFVTPLSIGALAGERAFTDLFDTASEFDVGHIRLARDCDLVIVAPATADLMAKMAHGLADDLASAVLLATDKPILIAPAMNPAMWAHPATVRNLAHLVADDVALIGPNAGEMAEAGESGFGRMAEPLEIVDAAQSLLIHRNKDLPLAGKRVLVTSGPTHEPIDPVRYIANRSSGKQGHAIARAAADAGADVTLVSGPVTLPDPPGVTTIKVESARDMLSKVEQALPVDIAVFAAAVADWRVAEAGAQKIKKDAKGAPRLSLLENPDILATIAHRKTKRPRLVIGFAAETERVIEHAKAKLARKGCDWILANDVSAQSGVMGGDRNKIHVVTAQGVESWPSQSKDDAARMLVERIAAALGTDAL